MQIVKAADSLRSLLQALKRDGKTSAFVPTMGNLHAGHLSLVQAAKKQADITIVSIFVNPAQFGPTEDLDSYPRTFTEDCEQLRQLGVDFVFAPERETMFPADVEQHTLVKIPQLSAQLCGVSRPVFFQGITTIVCKLFNIVQPDFAFFGEKDYQQLLCIQQMVADLHIPVKVIGMPIVREANGLAMSSRNNYLAEAEKQHAALLQQSLQWLREQVQNGSRDYKKLENYVKDKLNDNGFATDYVSVRRQSDLAVPGESDEQLIVLAAAMLGKTRLIDNIVFDSEG